MPLSPVVVSLPIADRRKSVAFTEMVSAATPSANQLRTACGAMQGRLSTRTVTSGW
jgi:hypothetical protein